MTDTLDPMTPNKISTAFNSSSLFNFIFTTSSLLFSAYWNL